MPTEVLLMSDVTNLGVAGDVVHVRDGYARNYLFPTGRGEPVTKNALRKLEKLRKEREELSKIQRAEALTKASKLKGLEITVTGRTVDETRLYGSVTAADIVEALAAKSIAVDRSQILVAEPFKEIGAFDVTVQLHPEVAETIKLTIAAE